CHLLQPAPRSCVTCNSQRRDEPAIGVAPSHHQMISWCPGPETSDPFQTKKPPCPSPCPPPCVFSAAPALAPPLPPATRPRGWANCWRERASPWCTAAVASD